MAELDSVVDVEVQVVAEDMAASEAAGDMAGKEAAGDMEAREDMAAMVVTEMVLKELALDTDHELKVPVIEVESSSLYF